MRKSLVIVGLLASSAVMLSAYNADGVRSYNQDENQRGIHQEESAERLQRNSVAAEDCVYEGEEAGTGYLTKEKREFDNSSNSRRGGRNRA